MDYTARPHKQTPHTHTHSHIQTPHAFLRQAMALLDALISPIDLWRDHHTVKERQFHSFYHECQKEPFMNLELDGSIYLLEPMNMLLVESAGSR